MSLPDLEILDEETAITEITFLPDGRICLFGASHQILELLGELNLGDTPLNARLASVHASTPVPTQAETVACHD